ncbi:MAG: hypothetical protein ACKVN9_07930 [Methylophilaceae bacterium]
MRTLLTVLLIAFATSAYSAIPTMKLNCGKVKGYKTEAERKYDGHLYNVIVTFITKRPDNKLADKVLRECISASLKLDDQKNILATAWFRPIAGSEADDDEQLKPHGDLSYISYKASTKKVEVKNLLDK